jgi:hypothetical protein
MVGWEGLCWLKTRDSGSGNAYMSLILATSGKTALLSTTPYSGVRCRYVTYFKGILGDDCDIKKTCHLLTNHRNQFLP